MKPSVGRIVYYKSHGSPNGEHKSEDRAAIITGVVSDDVIHLAVFNPTGMYFNLNVQRGDGPGQWDWMQYQKGQAKKTEELENSIATMVGQSAAQNIDATIISIAPLSANNLPSINSKTVAEQIVKDLDKKFRASVSRGITNA